MHYYHLFTRYTFEEGKEHLYGLTTIQKSTSQKTLQKSREVDKVKAAPLCSERVESLFCSFRYPGHLWSFCCQLKLEKRRKPRKEEDADG
jgi:hypothetical protein